MATLTVSKKKAFDMTDVRDINVSSVSKSSTKITLSDARGNAYIATGTNLSLSGSDDIRGNVTGIEYQAAGSTVYKLTGIKWDASFNGYDRGYTPSADVGTLYGMTAEMAYWLRGNDIIKGSNRNDILYGYKGNDEIRGNDGRDVIYGNSGADTLYGGDDEDILYGGSGADTLYGGEDEDILYGGSGKDSLFGGEDEDILYGGSGADILWGGEDEDRLEGGSGDDRLHGGDDEDKLFGGSGNDRLFGEEDNDRLNGGMGTNVLDGGDGRDTVYYNWMKTGITVSLAKKGAQTIAEGGPVDTLVSIENVVGTKYADKITGNSAANKLYGGAGNDVLKGGAGADVFVFNTKLSATKNVDKITDFDPFEDTIHLENKIFTSLKHTGPLSGAYFRANTTGRAQDSNDYIIYETDTGKLFYDADGNGSGDAVQFAVIGKNLDLDASDFRVI